MLPTHTDTVFGKPFHCCSKCKSDFNLHEKPFQWYRWKTVMYRCFFVMGSHLHTSHSHAVNLNEPLRSLKFLKGNHFSAGKYGSVTIHFEAILLIAISLRPIFLHLSQSKWRESLFPLAVCICIICVGEGRVWRDDFRGSCGVIASVLHGKATYTHGLPEYRNRIDSVKNSFIEMRKNCTKWRPWKHTLYIPTSLIFPKAIPLIMMVRFTQVAQ